MSVQKEALRVQKLKVQEVIGLLKSKGLPITRHGVKSIHQRGVAKGGLACTQSGPTAVLIQWDEVGDTYREDGWTKRMADALQSAAKVLLEAGYIVKLPAVDRVLTGPGNISDSDVSNGAILVYSPSTKTASEVDEFRDSVTAVKVASRFTS